MLELYITLLQASLAYLEEEQELEVGQISEAEISLSCMASFQGSVLFPQLKRETFIMLDANGRLCVYWMNDYNEQVCESCGDFFPPEQIQDIEQNGPLGFVYIGLCKGCYPSPEQETTHYGTCLECDRLALLNSADVCEGCVIEAMLPDER